MEKTVTGDRLAKGFALGPVELSVADLDRSVEYYTAAVGCQVLARGPGRVRLGVPGRALVALSEIPGASPASESSPGLSHLAPEVPTRADLARFIRHYTALGLNARTMDHVVAQSCYVTDPDGHRIEITCAAPRPEWRWQDNGYPVVVAGPLDMSALDAEPGADEPFEGLPAATGIGHVQLKVTDRGLAVSERFYVDVLGFEIGTRWGDDFLGVGVGDEISRLVLTARFRRDDSAPAPEDTARLLGVDLLLPGTGDLRDLAGRLATAGHPHELAGDVLSVRDPSGTLLRFKADTPATREFAHRDRDRPWK
jgi:catechol 2,3-dioxygenase